MNDQPPYGGAPPAQGAPAPGQPYAPPAGFGSQPGAPPPSQPGLGGQQQQQPGHPGQPGQPGQPGPLANGESADRAKGFLRSLFDFKFENFVAPSVLKVLYGFYLFMVVPAFFALLAVWYQALTHTSRDYGSRGLEREWDPEIGIFCGSTVMFPIMVFLYILMGRVLFERGILAFRQHALTKEMLEAIKKS